MAPNITISCLCVTHDRHEWFPWVMHQFVKQVGGGQQGDGGWKAELIIVDSSTSIGSDSPLRPDNCLYVRSAQPGIAGKRTEALALARGNFVTWFDDDDWQSPTKIDRCWDEIYGHSAVGARHAYMYSIESGQASLYESTYEPIIFNSAVYRKNSVPQNFDSTKITGEDTEWCERWLKTRPSYVTLGEPTHAWLCHGRNIVNKANSRFFEEPNPIPFDEWELGFLERMRAGR
jgi:glycosyltransferase involved in cell wall biosynthesis